MNSEIIKEESQIQLIKYENGKFGVKDLISKDDSGPRYRSQEMAEATYKQWVKEAQYH